MRALGDALRAVLTAKPESHHCTKREDHQDHKGRQLPQRTAVIVAVLVGDEAITAAFGLSQQTGQDTQDHTQSRLLGSAAIEAANASLGQTQLGNTI